jgi:hypothetical protein
MVVVAFVFLKKMNFNVLPFIIVPDKASNTAPGTWNFHCKFGIPKIYIFAGQTRSINRVCILQTIKTNESCLISLMKIALLAEPASMNAPLKQSRKATFIKLMLRFAPIVAHVQMYAL